MSILQVFIIPRSTAPRHILQRFSFVLFWHWILGSLLGSFGLLLLAILPAQTWVVPRPASIGTLCKGTSCAKFIWKAFRSERFFRQTWSEIILMKFYPPEQVRPDVGLVSVYNPDNDHRSWLFQSQGAPSPSLISLRLKDHVLPVLLFQVCFFQFTYKVCAHYNTWTWEKRCNRSGSQLAPAGGCSKNTFRLTALNPVWTPPNARHKTWSGEICYLYLYNHIRLHGWIKRNKQQGDEPQYST